MVLSQPQSLTNFAGTTASFNVAADRLHADFTWHTGISTTTCVLSTGRPTASLTLSDLNLGATGKLLRDHHRVRRLCHQQRRRVDDIVATGHRHAGVVGRSVRFQRRCGFYRDRHTVQRRRLRPVLHEHGGVRNSQPLLFGQAASTNPPALPRGTNFITAIYPGDADDLPATNTLAQIVTNHPPTAATAFYTRAAGLPLDIAIAGLATNWTDVDGDPISLAGISDSTNGVTLTNNAGTLVYFNSSNVADQFTATINDNWGGTNFQTVNIAVAFPGITGVVANGDGSVTLNLNGAPNQAYILETTTNLVSPAIWLPVATNTLDTHGVWQFTDTQATNFPQQFYRLQLLPSAMTQLNLSVGTAFFGNVRMGGRLNWTTEWKTARVVHRTRETARVVVRCRFFRLAMARREFAFR